PVRQGLAPELLVLRGAVLVHGDRVVRRKRRLLWVDRPLLLGRSVLQVWNALVLEARVWIVLRRVLAHDTSFPARLCLPPRPLPRGPAGERLRRDARTRPPSRP